MKAIRCLAVLTLVSGALLTCRAAYLHAKAQLAASLIRRAWHKSTQTGNTTAPWPWADTHPVARLRIPRLGYDEIVLEGATPRTLAFGPAHLLSGAHFGEPGNLILAGHRTSWFRPLEKVALGDTIRIEWFDSRGKLHGRSYRVALLRVTDPEDVSLLAPTPGDELTLITCYPFGLGPSSPKRFIVRASPLAADEGMEAALKETLVRRSLITPILLAEEKETSEFLAYRFRSVFSPRAVTFLVLSSGMRSMSSRNGSIPALSGSSAVVNV